MPVKTSVESFQTQRPCAPMKGLAGHSLQGASRSLPAALREGEEATSEKIGCKESTVERGHLPRVQGWT